MKCLLYFDLFLMTVPFLFLNNRSNKTISNLMHVSCISTTLASTGLLINLWLQEICGFAQPAFQTFYHSVLLLYRKSICKKYTHHMSLVGHYCNSNNTSYCFFFIKVHHFCLSFLSIVEQYYA